MKSLSFDGAKLHWTERGEGPAVLFLHAFPLSGAMWSKQLGALKDAYRAVAFDAPGFGKSAALPAPASMKRYAEAALALLDHLSIERAAVVGLSMGGYIAFEMHALAPGRVGALVLADTRATPDSPEARKAREATAHAVEDDGPQVLVERMLPNLLSPAAPPALRREAEKLITENAAEGLAAALRAMATRRDFSAALGSIACPTLVLAGDHDTLTPPAEAQAMAKAIPGARFEPLPGAGHLSNLESPKAFDAALRGFLDARRAGL